MDLCHCLQPVLDAETHKRCVSCGFYFDLKSWQSDPRVLRAREEKLAEARYHGFASLDSKVPIIRQKNADINVYGYCPCGSGKKIKFCHGLKGLDMAIKLGKLRLDQAQREIKENFPAGAPVVP